MYFARRSTIAFALFAAAPAALESQDRLPTMPGYAQFAQVAPLVSQVNQQINSQRVSNVTWLADGSGIEYTVGGQGGKRFRYVFATRAKSEIPFPTAGSRAGAEPAAPQG